MMYTIQGLHVYLHFKYKTHTGSEDNKIIYTTSTDIEQKTTRRNKEKTHRLTERTTPPKKNINIKIKT